MLPVRVCKGKSAGGCERTGKAGRPWDSRSSQSVPDILTCMSTSMFWKLEEAVILTIHYTGVKNLALMEFIKWNKMSLVTF